MMRSSKELVINLIHIHTVSGVVICHKILFYISSIVQYFMPQCVVNDITVTLQSHIYHKLFACSIEVGEVFVLKNRLSDDWGWATSQLSGESGLIPLNIMEECVRVCVFVCWYLLQHLSLAKQ